MLIAALVGLVTAFIASMPVAGPVAALVVRHALEGRAKSALALGLGTGLAEGIYAFLALWGFATFLADYPIVVPISKVVAACILIGLGLWFTRFTPKSDDTLQAAGEDGDEAAHHAKLRERTLSSLKVSQVMKKGSEAERPLQSFGVGFSVTLLNPTLLATWAAAATTIASMRLFPVEATHAPFFSLGVLVGATSWFGLLTWLLSRYRHHFSPMTLQRVIRAMGWGLIGLGVWFAIAFVIYLSKH